MKKKTRLSSARNNLTIPFYTALVVCVLGAFFSSRQFYYNFFRSLTKLNEEPIATITFKYKTAQRKFLSRVVWDRLSQNSPVYNGDTIHTSELSEATIWFNDGNVMDLSEKTMAQVFVKEDNSLGAELTGGQAVIDSGGAKQGMTLATGGVQVHVDAGASLSVQTAPVSDIVGAGTSSSAEAGSSTAQNNEPLPDAGVSIQVLSGTTTVDGKTVSAGDAVQVGKNGITQAPFVVTQPQPNARVIYYTEGKAQIPFSWKDNESGTVNVSVATDKSFSSVVAQADAVDGATVSLALDPGMYYWRVQNQNSMASGKMQVIQSLPPKQIAPEPAHTFTFRSKLPKVRFVWSESSFATSYQLVVSKSESLADPVLNQRSSLTSSIVSTLDEGTYFWQVTPYYTVNRIGLNKNASSPVASFTVTKNGQTVKQTTLLPADGGIVNIEKNNKPIRFSWRSDDDAVAYRIRIADNKNLDKPIIDKQTTDNYITFQPEEINLTEGEWYWSVTPVYADETEASDSDVRSFYAMKGAPTQRTIEPVEGYGVAATLVQDMQFTWKSNFPESYTSSIEIAYDADFSNKVYDTKVNGQTMKGANLAEGTYYWRLVTTGAGEGNTFTTPYKSFKVVGPLDAATLKTPDYRAIARESVPYAFSWSDVPDADYYKLKIYTQTDNALVYEDNLYEPTTSIDLFHGKDFIDKTYYRWEVQANANAIEGKKSRRSGRIADGNFYLLKLRPVEVTSPANGSKLDGADAILKPGKAQWSSVDAVSSAQFVLTKTDEGSNQVVMKVPSDDEVAAGKKAPEVIQLKPLYAGEYKIIVYAKTTDDIDISNVDEKNAARFTVLPVAPLADVKGLVATPNKFDADYLRVKTNPRAIKLSWLPVSNATDYVVTIKQKKLLGSKTLILKEVHSTTSYTLDISGLSDEDKKLFSNGSFTWTVKALRRINDEEHSILQQSAESSSTFETDLPQPTQAKATGAKNAYGK